MKIVIAIFFILTSINALSQKIEDDSIVESQKLIIEKSKKENDRFQKLSMAKEMALRSLEIEEPKFQGLVAVQAYKFNLNNQGNKNDQEIYTSLLKASERLNIQIDTIFQHEYLSPENELMTTQMINISKEICSIVNRNMNPKEWDYFTPFFDYQKTCD